MEPNWEHIKRDIQSKEVPLSADAWQQMDALLDASAPKKKAFYWWLLIPAILLLSLPIYWVSQTDHAPVTPKKETNKTIGVDKTESKTTPNVDKSNTDLTEEQVPESTRETTPKNTEVVLPEKPSKTKTAKTRTTKTTVTKSQRSAEILDANTSTQTGAEVIAPIEKTETNATPKPDSTEVFYEDETKLSETLVADSAQITPNKNLLNNNGNKGLWELKVYAGPTYNMPNIRYNSVAGYTNKEYANATNNSVKQGWGFDAGLEISYFLTPHFKVSTGIAYREIVTNNNMNYAVGEVPVIDSASGRILGYITLPQAVQQSNSSKNSFVYVGVPVSLFKEIPLRGRFSLTAEFVNTFNFLVKQSGEEINHTTLQIEDAKNETFNPLLINYQLRFGLRYRLNKNTSLALEPAYRGTYNNMYNSDYISWKPSDFALNMAIIYTFNKH